MPLFPSECMPDIVPCRRMMLEIISSCMTRMKCAAFSYTPLTHALMMIIMLPAEDKLCRKYIVRMMDFLMDWAVDVLLKYIYI